VTGLQRLARCARPRWLFTVIAIGALAWCEVYAFREGWRLQRAHPKVKLGAGPLVGSFDWRWSLRLLPAITIALVAVVVLPSLVRRVGARAGILSTAFAATAFAWALAASDGWSVVIRPVIDPTEYWQGTAKAVPAWRYLRTFLERQSTYSVHVRGHPPGFPMLLILLRWCGLGSAWFAAVLSFAGIALTVCGVGFCVHRLAGRESMVRCLPFLALAPYAVWQGTSADALFCGVAAVGLALVVVAMRAPSLRREVVAAASAGVVLGGLCFLTFGAPTLIPLVIAMVLLTRRLRWAVWAAVGAGAVVVLFVLGGYWWYDGLQATRRFYRIGTAQFRPGFYFFFANLAVLAIAVGPAALAGLTRLGRSRVTLIVVGGLACALLADASGLSKAETERIWVLYMPWIAVGAGSLATTVWRARWWLAAQAATAVVLQAALISKW
jgi:hypothetical protein